MSDNRNRRPTSDPYGAAGGYGRQTARSGGGQSRQGSSRTQYGQQPRQGSGRTQYGQQSRQGSGRVQYGQQSRQSYGRGQNSAQSRGNYQHVQNGRNGYANRSDEARSRARLEALRRQRAEEERERRRQESLRREKQLREEKKKLEKKMKARRREERKKARKTFFGRVAVGAVIFVILAVVAAILFAVFFTRSPDGKTKGKVTYVYGGTKVRTVSYGTAFQNGKMYVCFNDVADYLGMAVTGNAREMKFVIPDPDGPSDGAGTGREESIVFTVDTRTVTVNSRPVTVDVDSVLYGEKVWVSGDFVAEYVDGITVLYNKSRNTISVSRIEDEENSVPGNVVYVPVTLKLKSTAPMDAPDFENRPAAAPAVTFTADLAEYEEYMNPKSGDYTVLVNSAYPMGMDYVPDDLTDVRNTKNDGRETQQLRLCAAKALEALFDEMATAGITDVGVTSGYRSYDSQETLFNGYVEAEMEADPELSWEDAEAIVVTYSSRPGTSEHQTGLCVDMHNMEYATVEFAETDAYRWLSENAWKFGFIERYPAAKTEITGVSYEPWHWRFVGRNAAYAIHEGGLCLEEFVASDDAGATADGANGG